MFCYLMTRSKWLHKLDLIFGLFNSSLISSRNSISKYYNNMSRSGAKLLNSKLKNTEMRWCSKRCSLSLP